MGDLCDYTSDIEVCGKITAMTDATITVGGIVLARTDCGVVKAVATLTGGLSVALGASVCVHVKTDKAGNQVSATIEACADAKARAKLCGYVYAYARATATVEGNLGLGVKDWCTAAGSSITADAMLTANACVCVEAELDAAGKITAGAAASWSK